MNIPKQLVEQWANDAGFWTKGWMTDALYQVVRSAAEHVVEQQGAEMSKLINELHANHEDAKRLNWMQANLRRLSEMQFENGTSALVNAWAIAGATGNLRETVDAAMAQQRGQHERPPKP